MRLHIFDGPFRFHRAGRAGNPQRVAAMIRFDAALLARVDRAAKRCGVSRSAWVAFTLSKALDDEEQA